MDIHVIYVGLRVTKPLTQRGSENDETVDEVRKMTNSFHGGGAATEPGRQRAVPAWFQVICGQLLVSVGAAA